jgi:site-specific DNA recombinase
MSKKTLRCAIYTRKSTEEGLDQEFSSLDAQRESAQAYIRSQAHAGWLCCRERYDDGGFTGGNMERPALHRLLADIKAGQIHCVIVYKVDRLSRSLLDFARMMEIFEKHGVAFVSVTQQFNTATSMGRLVLNVLLSFAQFERELISERTRDKIAAARRKGKWAGGHPLLGYDVDPKGFKLVVNPDEAARVRDVYALYLEHGGMIPVVQELERRGWTNKSWVTRKGHARVGQTFSKTSLHRLLTNVVYLGQVKYKNEVHAGEHAAIIPEALWRAVQDHLRREGRTSGSRQAAHAPLAGLLRCRPCGCAMTPSSSSKKGGRRYRYYVCLNAVKRGRHACPSRSLSAPVIEARVLEEIRKADGAPIAMPEISLADQARCLKDTIERVEYDGRDGRLSITLNAPVSAGNMPEHSP